MSEIKNGGLDLDGNEHFHVLPFGTTAMEVATETKFGTNVA